MLFFCDLDVAILWMLQFFFVILMMIAVMAGLDRRPASNESLS